MKASLAAALAAMITLPVTQVGVAQEELSYVAVEPCRVADTRKSSQGVIRSNTSRNFRAYGNAGDLAAQGGQVDCLNPKSGDGSTPLAVSAYVVAVTPEGPAGNGIISAYPSNQAPPPRGAGATVNFSQGTIIGNTTIATLCDPGANSCPPDGGLGILVRDTDQHVVIDVQGYFYELDPVPGYEIVQASFAAANATTVRGEALCTEGKKVLGGGGSLVDPSWVLDSSNPRPDGLGWQVRYKTVGENFSAAGFAWAVCARVD